MAEFFVSTTTAGPYSLRVGLLGMRLQIGRTANIKVVGVALGAGGE